MVYFDLVLLHAPSIYDFREKSLLAGPISDVVPSSPVFEMYPIGLTSIADYLERFGLKVKIINIANRMLMDPSFNVENKLKKIKAKAFGIDFHWLPHAHGSIELAKIVRKLHPNKPIIFGGLSATYYHEELIKYPFIDFVMRGDSTEKLILTLIDEINNGSNVFSGIPNLTWKSEDGEVHVNPLTYVPDNLNEFDVPGYRYTIKSVFKYLNYKDPLPYNGWLQYPNTAILTARGCTQGCLICGGSKIAYKQNCNRPRLALRSPEKLVEDIIFIQRFSRAPIFILHDIRQGGKEYVDEFLGRLKNIKLKNELVFELFQYANEKFFQKINEAVPKYSMELTLETHDEDIRRYNGKFRCTNKKVIDSLNYALKHGCAKIDLFFMVGIPEQDYASALKNIEFVEEIHNACNQDKRLSYFVAPLAPFLDPASPAFENPDLHGYKKFCLTLEDHREAIKAPSWKYMLSYETNAMSRDEIVNSTYESAKLLNEFKYKYDLISELTYNDVNNKIDASMKYIDQIDKIMALPEAERADSLAEIQKEIEGINEYSICGENELKWEVKKNYANFISLTMVGMELLIEDIAINLKRKFSKV
ncbi:MAG: radical protein [Bacillales bacterium]|jgi:B12-binding domain/radical SAM domain protein|nr:radical protein [Bacillales bacterium]